jgi:hypothetical protein
MNTHVHFSVRHEYNLLNMEQKVFPARVIGENELKFYTQHTFSMFLLGLK